ARTVTGVQTCALPISGLARPHDRLAVFVDALHARVEDRLEELGRQGGEHAWVAGYASVAAAVEKKWRPFPVAHVLDAAEEERMEIGRASCREREKGSR